MKINIPKSKKHINNQLTSLVANQSRFISEFVIEVNNGLVIKKFKELKKTINIMLVKKKELSTFINKKF